MKKKAVRVGNRNKKDKRTRIQLMKRSIVGIIRIIINDNKGWSIYS